MWGLGSMYMMSRRGSKGMMDFSMMKKCYPTTLTWFMVGSAIGMSLYAFGLQSEVKSGRQMLFHRRVHQNEQTHALLKSMKFHLATRQLDVWDQDPR